MAEITAPPLLIGRLLAALGTITAETKVIDTTVTWNQGATDFTAWHLNVTDTSSPATARLMDLQVGSAPKFRVLKSGATLIGDTSNANVTLGLTINQGAADDDILSLKSSDVAHGMTSLTETDTYASVAKASGAEGGLFVQGFAEGTGAIYLRGHHTTDNTLKTTSAVGCLVVDARLKAAASSASCGANANLLVVRNDATARFIVDAEGTPHSDEAAATF